MAPWMWIIAGPNGAGKSTFAGPYLDHLQAAFPALRGSDGIVKLNADERTLELRQQFSDMAQEALNRRAAQEIDAEVESMIAAGRSFAVETVLSTPKYRDDVEAAQAKGFRFGLMYVSLHPSKLAVQRVSERVQKGGHDVDPAAVIRRYRRSHEQLGWFAPRADFLMIFDNSNRQAGTLPVLLAHRYPGRPFQQVRPGVNRAVDRAVAAAFALKS
jgi:predicted ABC-type ATPase